MRGGICRATCVAAGLALAWSIEAAAANLAALPAAKTAGGIAYISGGIGQDEQAAMESVADRYDVLLVFAEQGSGAYLSDVRVAIDDASGTRLFEAVSEGPMMLLSLPAGRYRVSALDGERLQVRTFVVTGRKTSRIVLHWPVAESE